MTQKRLTIAAVALYAVSGFAYLWVHAREFAREATPGLVALVMWLFHLPLLIAGVAARRFVRWRMTLRAQRSAR